MKKYNAMYYLKKFDAIPEDEWTTLKFKLIISSKLIKYCALGHCGMTIIDKWTIEAKNLDSLMYDALKLIATEVNDSPYIDSHLGDTPKKRIMNALLLINAGVTV